MRSRQYASKLYEIIIKSSLLATVRTGEDMKLVVISFSQQLHIVITMWMVLLKTRHTKKLPVCTTYYDTLPAAMKRKPSSSAAMEADLRVK